mgnify:CR=1 FL=1
MNSEPEANLVGRLADSLVDGVFDPVDRFFEANGVVAPVVIWEPTSADTGTT